MILTEASVLIDHVSTDSFACIHELSQLLCQIGYVNPEYGKLCCDRERLYPTGLPTKPFAIAIPHAEGLEVNESSLSVAILRDPVNFQNMADPEEALPVEVVLLMATKNPEEQVSTLQKLAEIFSSADELRELRSQSSKKGVADWINQRLG